MKLKKLFVAMAFLYAGLSLGYSQETITADINNAKLAEAIGIFEKNTSYTFFYDAESIDMNITVSLTADNLNVTDAVSKLLTGTGIIYTVRGYQIALSPAKASTCFGRIVATNGEPVIGGSVMIGGTTIGTVADIDGKFSLPEAKLGDKLVFSCIGFKSETVMWNGNTMVIVLNDDSTLLDDVVVVGYGTEKKVNVIGSISTVSSKQLENRSTSNVANSLVGQMPGVTILQTSGAPGADVGEIRVRGVGSFGATPSALVLIDGIPGSLANLHPEDIESISVLKDASTAAIYGSRAANGVILVTTKSGKSGKIAVNYNSYASLTSATELPEKVNSWEYATLYNQASGAQVYSDAEIQAMKTGSDPDHYANENYLDELFHSGFQTGHDLSISGGDENNKYMISAGYMRQNGIIDNNNYTRYNIRLNTTNTLAKGLILTSRIQGMIGVQTEPTTVYGKDSERMTAIIADALRWPGINPTKLSNGKYGSGNEGFGTSIMWVNSKSFYSKNTKNFSINERLDWEIIDGFKVSAIGAYAYTGSESKHFRSTYTTDVKTSTSNYIENGTDNEKYITFQGLLNYDKTIANHAFGFLLGYSWEQDDYRYLTATRSNLPSDDYPEIAMGDADTAGNDGGGNSWALQSVFGRLNYNYSERYLISATFRYDGSSRFPKDNRYAFFPSVAFGYRLSEESFIKENVSWLNSLKIKGSVGKLGNQNIGNYPYQSTYEIGYNYPFGSTLSQGVAIITAVDPTLHWEETRTIDAGIEGSFFNGKLTFDFTWFNRKTSGILFSPSASVSSVYGFNLSKMNMGELRNNGIEVTLGYRNFIGDFNYYINGNFTYVSNKVITLGLADVQQSNGLVGNGTYFVGYPMEVYYGYRTDGVFLSDAEASEWTDQSAIARGLKAGDIRYVDINHDNVVNADDREVLGSRIPPFTFGLSLGFDWKGIDFSMQLQGVAGVSGYLSNYAGFAFWGYGSLQRWQAEGCFNPSSPKRHPLYPRLEILSGAGSNNTLVSDFWVRDGSYLRIKNAQLGYSFPTKWFSKSRVQKLRLYLQSENPFTFHNYPKGWDPEINTGGTYYPILKSYTFGINFTF